MLSNSTESDYPICPSCIPRFEGMIDDMTKHISKEISLLRVNSPGLLDEGINPIKIQPFPKTLGRFLSKIMIDLQNNDTVLIEAYCKDLLNFTDSINYKTRGSGNLKYIFI